MSDDKHSAEKDAGHRWQIDPEGNGHRARCACGWEGHRRVRWADARREGDQHHHDTGHEKGERL